MNTLTAKQMLIVIATLAAACQQFYAKNRLRPGTCDPDEAWELLAAIYDAQRRIAALLESEALTISDDEQRRRNGGNLLSAPNAYAHD